MRNRKEAANLLEAVWGPAVRGGRTPGVYVDSVGPRGDAIWAARGFEGWKLARFQLGCAAILG